MIIDFLKAELTDEDLTTALRVLLVFKGCESKEEWFACPFVAWIKLEQMEEFLQHRANGQPLKADTIAHMEARER